MRMKFVDAETVNPEVQVPVELHQDEMHLDVLIAGVLVGFFANGEFYLCSFGPANKDMYDLESKGVVFEKRVEGQTSDNQYQFKINR